MDMTYRALRLNYSRRPLSPVSQTAMGPGCTSLMLRCCFCLIKQKKYRLSFNSVINFLPQNVFLCSSVQNHYLNCALKSLHRKKEMLCLHRLDNEINLKHCWVNTLGLVFI